MGYGLWALGYPEWIHSSNEQGMVPVAAHSP